MEDTDAGPSRDQVASALDLSAEEVERIGTICLEPATIQQLMQEFEHIPPISERHARPLSGTFSSGYGPGLFPPQFHPSIAQSGRVSDAANRAQKRGCLKEFYFCIDRGDRSSTAWGEGYDLEYLSRCRYYFKVNYNRSAIDSDPLLEPHSRKIIPIAQGFAVRVPQLLPSVPGIGANRSSNLFFNALKQFARYIISTPAMADFLRFRNTPTDTDIVFIMSHYPDHDRVSALRREVLLELKRRPGIKAISGLASYDKLPEELEALRIDYMPMKIYLRSLARSKIVIYVRGPHDCVAAKLTQYLALGKPIIGQKILNNADNLYRCANFADQFAFEDPEIIVEKVLELLNEPRRLRYLSQSNAHTFDTLFRPEAVASNILKTISGAAQLL